MELGSLIMREVTRYGLRLRGPQKHKTDTHQRPRNEAIQRD